MKKLCLALIVYVLFSYLNSEIVTDDIERTAEEMARKAEIMAEEAEEAAREVEIAQNTALEIQQKPESSRMETPFMGVYFKDLTFEDAREKNYKYMYGVLISGVTQNTPARLYRLVSGDILMEIGGIKVYGRKHVTKVISQFYVGDKVTLKIFRDGVVKDIEFVFGSRYSNKQEKTVAVDRMKKRKLSVGHGGAGWMPVYLDFDALDDINELREDLGFRTLPEDGLVLPLAIAGHGNVGKGWFIGGMGAFYWQESKEKTNDISSDTIRRMHFSMGYGGVTIDKRFAITKKIICSGGLLLGGGGYTIELNQTDGEYNWDTMNEDLADSNNNYVKLTKSYMIVQPRVTVMYRILDWLSLKAEAGYMYGYSFSDGWKANVVDDSYEVEGSPKTDFEGYTIMIGPWFGF